MWAGRIYAIAANTSREAMRNRAFAGLLVVALAFLLSSIVLSELSVRGDAKRILIDFGLFAISLFSVVIAVATGVILVHKEIDKKTIFTLIPKPVERREILIGKYLGMMVNLVVVLGVLSLIWFVVLLFRGVTPTGELVKALVLIFAETAIIASIAIAFSAFSSPALSGVFTLGCFALGRTVVIIEEMLQSDRSIFAKIEALKPLGEAYVYTFPDLATFNVAQEVLLDIPITSAYMFGGLGYALAYIVFFLVVGIVIFERRDFL